ncbi:MAG: hypothetical protein M3Q42_10445 [Pseudomonadota bacterium]|nr:hypothetical protein [Pseudomonadota bacterium]
MTENPVVDAGAATEKYRPSNGTEGDGFMAQWCDRCAKLADCEIVTATMAYDVEDDEYPGEWIEDEANGPRCTAFIGANP